MMLQRFTKLCSVGALLALTLAGNMPAGATTDADARSMAPAVVEGGKAIAMERFFGSNDVTYRIAAEPWIAPVVDNTKAVSGAATDRQKPTQIGFARNIPATLRALPLTSLQWQDVGDGSRVIRVEFVAADAAAFRVGYHVEGPANGLQVRFSGQGRDEVYLSESSSTADLTWSPVLEGATGTIELRLMPGFSPTQFSVNLDQVSHIVVSPSELGHKDIRQIGQSGSCNIDVACELQRSPSQALLDISRATAKMVFTSGSSTYLCTGTLLNSTSGANYFYGASHCISTQAEASTLNTYWFFDAVACNSTAIPPYQLVTGGADLRVTDTTLDVTLLQLRQSPPTGAVRAGWNASVIPTGTAITGIHHPSGDLKKFSAGNMLGYVKGPLAYDNVPRTQAGKDSFISVTWTRGTTEGGSSGSGVFTFNAAGYYQLRGGLEGGAASCDSLTGVDRFSRMDLLFTKLAPYLAPSFVIPVSTATQSTMVEFFNPQVDFYFISSRENEKTSLDSFSDSVGNHLWYRTGYWFKTDPTPTSSTSSITRYYIPGAAKAATRGSHFYTALNSDKSAITGSGRERFAPCDSTPNTYFCNEGTDSYIASPIKTGTVSDCLSTEQKIYRVFRGPPRYVDDGNHRYITNADMYAYMVNDQGWSGESVNFCAKP